MVAEAWDISSCRLTGAMAACGATDQQQQYSRNGRKIKIIILYHVMEAMLRLPFSNRLRSSLAGRVAPRVTDRLRFVSQDQPVPRSRLPASACASSGRACRQGCFTSSNSSLMRWSPGVPIPRPAFRDALLTEAVDHFFGGRPRDRQGGPA